MSKKPDFFAAANAAADGAPLKTKAPTDTKNSKVKTVRIPNEITDRFTALKAKGKTSLDYTAYIVEALREKLERDEN